MKILKNVFKKSTGKSKASGKAGADAIEEFLTRGVEQVFPSKPYLKKRLEEGKTLTMYWGIDPTGPTLHLGHYVVLRKFRQFQKMGHKIIFLIGGFTAMIGDPSDKSATRVRLTSEEVMNNADRYKDLASKVIDFGGSNPAEFKNNADWLGKLSFGEVVEIASNFTVQQMLERDMFENRMKDGKPIYLHEFLYPLMQGYDSVAMGVDGEIAGNDQTFNALAGRTLMKKLSGKEKFVVATKLLVDASGKKMGKTENNMASLADSSKEMFGKIMSWTDGMIVPGFELLTDVSEGDIKKMEKEMSGSANPKEFKVRLAKEVISDLFSKEEADEAAAQFDSQFGKGALPDDIPTLKTSKPLSIIDVLIESGICNSKSDARRQIDGGGVKIEGVVTKDYEAMVQPGQLVQKGKRFFIRLKK